LTINLTGQENLEKYPARYLMTAMLNLKRKIKFFVSRGTLYATKRLLKASDAGSHVLEN